MGCVASSCLDVCCRRRSDGAVGECRPPWRFLRLAAAVPATTVGAGARVPVTDLARATVMRSPRRPTAMRAPTVTYQPNYVIQPNYVVRPTYVIPRRRPTRRVRYSISTRPMPIRRATSSIRARPTPARTSRTLRPRCYNPGYVRTRAFPMSAASAARTCSPATSARAFIIVASIIAAAVVFRRRLCRTRAASARVYVNRAPRGWRPHRAPVQWR